MWDSVLLSCLGSRRLSAHEHNLSFMLCSHLSQLPGYIDFSLYRIHCNVYVLQETFHFTAAFAGFDRCSSTEEISRVQKLQFDLPHTSLSPCPEMDCWFSSFPLTCSLLYYCKNSPQQIYPIIFSYVERDIGDSRHNII